MARILENCELHSPGRFGRASWSMCCVTAKTSGPCFRKMLEKHTLRIASTLKPSCDKVLGPFPSLDAGNRRITGDASGCDAEIFLSTIYLPVIYMFRGLADAAVPKQKAEIVTLSSHTT